MNGFLLALIALAFVHVVAILLGRLDGGRTRRVAMASGILGLLSIPAAFLSVLTGFCIAGACRHRGLSQSDIAVAVVLALALSSMLSVAVLCFRKPRDQDA